MKFNPRLATLVFLGGAIGSALRYWTGLQLLDSVSLLLVVNIAGTFALGLAQGNKNAPSWVTALFGTGFAGGFTTMSGLSVLLASAHFVEIPTYLSYAFVMFVAAVIAYWLGSRLTRGAQK